MKDDYFANSSEKIVLIDQASKIKDTDFIYKENRVPDIRVVSLTPASIRFFKSIGLWELLDDKLIKYAKGMQVWESKGSCYMHLDSRDNRKIEKLLSYLPSTKPPRISTEYVCALIEINHLLSGFSRLLKDRIKIVNMNLDYDNVDLEHDENYACLIVHKEKQVYRNKIIVASDGAKSVIRNKLNIPTFGYDYNETGLVCTLRGNVGSDIAYQRFLHNGVFALLPLYDDLYSIVSSMPKNINENLKKLDDESFIKFVNKILHDPSDIDLSQLDRLSFKNNFSNPPIIKEVLSKRLEFPLQLQYAKEITRKNFVLIGDASHVIHPMAGQGLNLGIADSALLAHYLIQAKQLGRSLNDQRTIDRFARDSKANSQLMIGVIEALKNIYKPTNRLVTGVRNLGLTLFNKSSYVKSLFMLGASGEIVQPNKYAWEK